MIPDNEIHRIREAFEGRAEFLQQERKELDKRLRAIDEAIATGDRMKADMDARVEREGKTEYLLLSRNVLYLQRKLLQEEQQVVAVAQESYICQTNIVMMWSYFYDHFYREMEQRGLVATQDTS